MAKILIALAITAVVLVLSEGAVVPHPFQFAAQQGQNCKCMPWSVCNGKYNDNVYCYQSYIMKCCIIDPVEEVAGETAKIIPMELDNEV